jgi:Alpha/beta hydrolase of unknown function (DUF900)
VTYFVNLRAGSWGAVCSPYLLNGDPLSDPPAINSLSWDTIGALVRGKDLLLASHGFNVSYDAGLASLARLEEALQLAASSTDVFLGILWPGDWVIPAVNYPAEDKIASHAGRLLGQFCNEWLTGARGISFVSHSLGARVILEAIQAHSNRVKVACITAGAVNAGCLHEEYSGAASNCDRIRTLSSRGDHVLEFAYPPGDFLADILYPDHPQFEAALGRGGPTRPIGVNVVPYEIDDSASYDHGDYFPPGGPDTAADPRAKWNRSAQFIASVYRGKSPSWPNS